MRFIRDFSIKRKLMIIIMLTSFVGIFLSSASIVIKELISFRESMVENLVTLSEVIGTNSAASLIFNDPEAARETLAALKAEPHVCRASIYTKEGKLFAEYFNEVTKGHPLPGRSEGEAQRGLHNSMEDGHQFRDGHLNLYKNIVLDGEMLGSVYILSDLQKLYSRMKVYTGIVAGFMLISIFVAYLLSARFQRVISDPILYLAQKMNDISDEKNYTIRVEKRSQDEVGVLIDGFNEMLAQIQERDSRLEQHRQELEDQVARRTAELSTTNESLKKEIDERKRTGEALRVSEEKFRSLVELTSDWVWETDQKGDFTYADPTIRDFLGYEPEEVLGKTMFDFMPEDEARRVHSLIEAFGIKAEPYTRFEITQTHKDGRHLVIEASATPIIDADGNLTGWRGIDTDITERKRAEEALKQARREAVAANRAKSEFLANMSHEIRTPMNGIMGMVQILQDTKLDSEQRESLDVIKKSSDALLGLINDILDISKIEAGKLEMETIPFNLRITVEDVVESIAARASQKGLETACLIESDVPVFLKGDPGRLRQVLINLMGNAIKFTEKGEVSTRVSLGQDEKDDVILCFEVADTGIGIPPDRVQAIFDAFSQADGSTTRKYGGTGLGLAISRQLVEMMGGEIGVDSVEGQSSTFRFTARFSKDAEAGVSEPLIDEHIDIRNTRILVVDDNETNRLVCSTMLEPFGCRMTAVKSGLEALDSLRAAAKDKDPFKLVLLDQMMPEMSGEQTARQIKADPLIRETIVIILTSLGNRGDIRRLKDFGVNGYLSKPARQDQLHKAVITAIGQGAGKPDEITPMITRHTIAEASFDDTLILLVEDQILNQKVAARMLQQWGFKVIIAENGQKAIKALETSNFDLVLMDIQMPVMDGLTATSKIRDKEKDAGGHIPIIAMTANAMKGDREKYLAAGMDDFVPKPIVKEVLYDTMAKWVKIKAPETDLAPKAEAEEDAFLKEMKPSFSSSGEVFDLSPVLDKFGDDMSFFCELAEIYLKETPERIEALEQSLINKDAKGVETLAHKLKGTSGNFGIDGLYNLFSELQELGKESKIKEASKVLSKATALYQQVESSLKKSLEGLSDEDLSG